MISGSDIAAGLKRMRRAAAGAAFASAMLAAYSPAALAQSLAPSPLPTGIANAALSAPSAIADLASKFLRDNANQAKARVWTHNLIQ